MDIFDIFAAAKFEYAVYSNLAATEEQQLRQLLLHLIETKGKGQSIEEIKAMKKNPKSPNKI